MNGTAPAPQVEEIRFTDAEMRIFQKKWKVYQEAADVVNEFLAFLREQHGVDAKDGWQLGDRGFIRPVQTPPPDGAQTNGDTEQKNQDAPPANIAKPRKAKKIPPLPSLEPVLSANGHGEPAPQG